MKKSLQVVFTFFVGVSFLLLSACPKKITPIKKSSRVTRPTAKLPKTPKPPDEASENGILKEEAIVPRIVPLEESETPLPKKEDPIEKASALKDVYFDLDQSAPRSIDKSIIESNVNWLIAHPKENVRLEGHGDSRGTNEYNLILGEKRANSVKNYMVTLGVEPSRLTVISYGEERAFCTREDDTCYQENRRTHFHVE